MWAMLMLWLLPADAQQAKQYFVSMPDTILPLLTEINRADCIDFLESNMRAIVTNRLDGKSEMTTLTDNYIEIKEGIDENAEVVLNAYTTLEEGMAATVIPPIDIPQNLIQ